ncbi:unnamed protein product [Periconia digitata]|uniref:Uncharacterized protein n=1 Tax=Periconia digitata TaxID=1303443 RepID=A0A9W4XD59_9PLEO|nr:unnamed protein product [Periconia digitata]
MDQYPWEVIRNGLALPQHAQKWWDKTAPKLGHMLQGAGYDAHEQYKILLFFWRYIVIHFGPYPEESQKDSSLPFWKSFMTDDNSPMELSWAWDSINSLPEIRFSIEAIGFKAGTAEDPSNQLETLKLMSELKVTQPQFVWELFEYFHNAFQPSSAGPNSNQEFPHRSSLGLGFKCSRVSMRIGAYLTPPVLDPTASWNYTYDVISKFRKDETSFPTARQLHDFLTQTETGKELRFVGLGIDCVKINKSRLKIYVRSRETSVESMRNILTMNGTMPEPWTDSILKKLYTLLDMVAPGYKDSQVNTAQTAGMLYNFDIHSGRKEPYSRIYIPVKHYGIDDLSIAQGLERFQKIQGRTDEDQSRSYLEMLRQVYNKRKLEDGKGLQTFIAISPKDGSLAIAAYVSPHAYTERGPGEWPLKIG